MLTMRERMTLDPELRQQYERMPRPLPRRLMVLLFAIGVAIVAVPLASLVARMVM